MDEIDVIKNTMGKFVKNYHQAPDRIRELKTDEELRIFICGVETNSNIRLSYFRLYEEMKFR